MSAFVNKTERDDPPRLVLVEDEQALCLADVARPVADAMYPRLHIDQPHLLLPLLRQTEEAGPDAPAHTLPIYLDGSDDMSVGWLRGKPSSVAGAVIEEFTRRAEDLGSIAELEFVVRHEQDIVPAVAYDAATDAYLVGGRSKGVRTNFTFTAKEFQMEMAAVVSGLQLPMAVEVEKGQWRVTRIADPGLTIGFLDDVSFWLRVATRLTRRLSMRELYGFESHERPWRPSAQMRRFLQCWKKDVKASAEALLVKACLSDGWYFDNFQNDARAQKWFEEEREIFFGKS